MNIQNLEKLSTLLDESQLKQLDAAASVHKKQSNLEFTIVGLEDRTLIV